MADAPKTTFIACSPDIFYLEVKLQGNFTLIARDTNDREAFLKVEACMTQNYYGEKEKPNGRFGISVNGQYIVLEKEEFEKLKLAIHLLLS